MIIIADIDLQKNIIILKEEIKNTLRIEQLEIFEKDQEDNIKEKPDLKKIVDELGIIFYFSH